MTMSELTAPVEPGWFAYAILFVLTCLSGCFSGLNLGLMSLTTSDLNIVISSSPNAREVENAKRILPLRKRGNLLLCTLLIGNTVVNVMLAVITDPIWVYWFGPGPAGTVLALAIPSALIVVFGEIVPQSVCSRYALSIGARTVPLTLIFMVVLFPIAFPISVLLVRLQAGRFQLFIPSSHASSASPSHVPRIRLHSMQDKILGDEISGVFTRRARSLLSLRHSTLTRRLPCSYAVASPCLAMVAIPVGLTLTLTLTLTLCVAQRV